MTRKRGRVTTIRLCPETAQIADEQIGNLSKFVRTQLKEFAISKVPLNYHNAWRSHLEICYPFKSAGFCRICWPQGVPTQDEWDEWLQMMRDSGKRLSLQDFRKSIEIGSAVLELKKTESKLKRIWNILSNRG